MPGVLHRVFWKHLSAGNSIERLTDIMCNPNTYKVRRYTGKDGDILLASASNLYSGVTRKKAEAFYAALEDPSDTSPVEHGLNSRLILKDGVVQEEVYKTDGKYGPALEQVCYWLEKAAEVAENPRQAEYIHTL